MREAKTGFVVAVKQVFIPHGTVYKGGLIEKGISGFFNLWDGSFSRSHQRPDFQRIVVGSKNGGFIQGFSIVGYRDFG